MSPSSNTAHEGVLVRAPLRADLAGGTLDIWPLGLLDEGGATVAAALTLRAEARCGPPRRPGHWTLRAEDLGREIERPALAEGEGPVGRRLELLERLVRHLAPGEGLSLATRSPVRAGSGLGTSSALGIAASIAICRHRRRPARRDALVALVRDVEAQILGIPTGTQDHEAAWRGGVLVLHPGPGGLRATRLPSAHARALSSHLIVVDSGEGRSSGPSNWDMIRRRIEGEGPARRALRAVGRAGRRAAEALDVGDWRALGRAMRADLDARRGWSDLVMTPALDELFESAREAGAYGEKVCGAGGGGFAVVLAAPERRARVLCALEEAGGLPVDAGVSLGGATSRRAAGA